MSGISFILTLVISSLSFFIGLIYIVGALRTKDKTAAYIGIALLIVCLISLLMLAF